MSLSPERTLCAPFVEQLSVQGAAVTVFDNTGRQVTVCATSPLAARIDEVQFELGEGPAWEAFRTGEASLINDAAGPEALQFPGFAAALAEMPVGAVFALPMCLGAAAVGVVTLYRDYAIALSAAELQFAAGLVNRTTPHAVALALSSAAAATEPLGDYSVPLMRREVHQATGILIVQLDVTATEAFLRLRAHSFATGRPIQDLARDVVARVIDFRDLDPV